MIITIISMMAFLGCSSGSSGPTAPDIQDELSEDPALNAQNATIMGVYDVTFDPSSMELEIAESRNADAHYDITGFVAPHSTIYLTAFDPVAGLLKFDLQVANPSIISVYDVRAIFLASSASGYSMVNADDYTQLFNPFGPSDVNPFRAYAKSVTNRKFGGGAIHKESFEILCPTPVVLPFTFQILIECSHPKNCEDVYEISNQTVSNPINSTTTATITLDAFDHQNNIGQVYVDTTPITGGLTWMGKIGPTLYTGALWNSAGAAPGTYRCRITADSFSSPDNLFDFVDITVIPDVVTPPPGVWTWTGYNLLTADNGYDLGVIGDAAHPRGSHIVMADDNLATGDEIVLYDPYYPSYTSYVSTLVGIDPADKHFQPYPVERIDAADDGAFSFTNGNPALWTPTLANNQVWTCFDNVPQMHTGVTDSRYALDLYYEEAFARPVDVCDDFSLNQYGLFSSFVPYTSRDLVLMGTTPSTYTNDKLKYLVNLDTWVGYGDSMVNNTEIYGIDVNGIMENADGDMIRAYILEKDTYFYQVEVYDIIDTAPVGSYDWATPYLTITITNPMTDDLQVIGHDIELLPPNNDYELNPNDPTLAVLVSWHIAGAPLMSDVYLYNANTGAFLESIGGAASVFEGEEVRYLDTDDGVWEIHVTYIDVNGNAMAMVFDY